MVTTRLMTFPITVPIRWPQLEVGWGEGMLCSSVVMAFASYSRFLSICQKSHMASIHHDGPSTGKQSEGKAPEGSCGVPVRPSSLFLDKLRERHAKVHLNS